MFIVKLVCVVVIDMFGWVFDCDLSRLLVVVWLCCLVLLLVLFELFVT